ncbi:MAG: zinc-ribbon domain-containing protein [Candidatus Hodarchaeales archaeon]|jgi:hypothetical protein
MDSKESPRKCPKCGVSLLPQAKFCTQCGTSLIDTIAPPPDHKEPEVAQQTVQEPSIETEVAPPDTTPSQLDTTLDYGLNLLSSLRENISSVIVVLGVFSIIAAIAFTIIFLLPKEFVSDVEIPPLEGIIFDLFVILGLIAILAKELTVFLGYIPKKETLDRWFSFVLILISWINLITFSIRLVETSLFYQIGLNFSSIFIFLSLVNFLISLLYFWRYHEPLFSISFIMVIMSIVYLLPWIIPIDPEDYTILIFLTTFGVVIVSRLVKDIIPFITLTVLLPLMFLSPHLLSNSVVIAIISLLISFPFIEAFLRRLVIKKPEKKDLMIKTLSELCSTFGMVNVSFSVFYGHLPPEFSIFILTIPVFGFLILKVMNSNFQRLPLRDWPTSVFLLFTLVFFDFIIKDLLILFGVAFLLVIYSTFTVFEYMTFKQQNLQHYAEFVLIASLVTVSMTNLFFIWKICLLAIPLLTLLTLIQQKKTINQQLARSFVFGSEILFLLTFLRSPEFDLLVIPIFFIMAVIGVFILFIFYEENNKIKYSLDLTIFSLIFEVTLLVIMLWTESSESLYPVFLLLVLVAVISIIQLRQKIAQNFLWLNSTFVVCFGLMTYWNDFDVRGTVLTTFLLILPILIEVLLSKDIENSSIENSIVKNRNLNISFSAIGLALIVFFEELDPISHSLLFLIFPISWMIIYLSDKGSSNSLTVLSIIVYPGIIFTFEMLLEQTIFTPISDNMYLYLTLLVLAIPAITLQAVHFLRKRTEITINPFIIGTALTSLIIMVALWTYKFQLEELIVLVFGLTLAVIVSILLIKWQYESVLLLLVSFLPSTLYAGYIDFPSTLAIYLIPIFPILLNFLMALTHMKTDLSVQLHEFLMLIYFGLFILFNPMKMIEYTTALMALFSISWFFLVLIKRKINQKWLILTNLLNSAFVLILIVFIDPLISESFIKVLGMEIPLNTTLISLIIVIIAFVTILHLVKWQIAKISSEFSYLMALTLVFNSSSFVLSLIPLLIRSTEFEISYIVLGILAIFTILLISSLISYSRVSRLKPDISLACIYTTAVWVLLSSIYFSNIELIFLWIFFAPIFVMVFLTKQKKTIVFLGIVFYFMAGLRLIEHILEFVLSGNTEWATILGLIVFGIELVSLGIYQSISRKTTIQITN